MEEEEQEEGGWTGVEKIIELARVDNGVGVVSGGNGVACAS